MACNLTNGLNSISSCKTAVGGIETVYLTNSYNVTATTETNSSVTAISMSAGTGFYEFKPDKKSSNWSQTTLDTASGNIIPFEQTVTLVFSKNDSDDINTIKMLAQGYFDIIVKSKDGRYYLLQGTDNEGLELASGSEFQSGTLISDPSNWTLVFKAEALNPAPEVVSTIIDALILG